MLLRADGFMLEAMNEPDEIREQKLNDALEKAKAAGRGDVADYLSLKSSNDAIRAAGVKWLFDSALAIAAELNRQNAAVTIENESPHNFAFGNANLVGLLVRCTQGVRCLTVEAGWTRSPADGFMRGGALACARISHFGMSRNDEQLLLVRVGDSVDWFAVDTKNERRSFDSRNLQRHFQTFLATI